MLEIGAFPFTKKKGKLYVMLVTNTSGKLWILPKGHPEPDLKNHQVAELETFEEAGVAGKILSKSLHKEFKRENGGMLLICPLLIEDIFDKWQEQSKRQRRLVKIKEALSLVTRKEHLNAIKHFSSTEIKQQLILNR